MEDKQNRIKLFFAVTFFAAVGYVLWRNALVEGWPEDFNGWLGLIMTPIFSIGSLIYLIFYRRVKQHDDNDE